MVSGLRFCWPLGGPAHPRFAAVPGLLALLSDGASNVAAIKPATNTPFDGVDLPDLVEEYLQPHEGQQGEGSLLPSHGDAEDVLQHDEGLLPPFRGEIADNNLANDGQDALLLADASSEHKEEKGLDPYDADNDLQKPQIEGQKSVTGVLLPINAEILFFGDVLLRAGAFDPEDVAAVACASVHEDACEDDAAEDAAEDAAADAAEDDSAVDAYASLAYEDVPTAHADASDSEDNSAEFLEEAASTDSNEDHVASADVVESVDVAFAAADGEGVVDPAQQAKGDAFDYNSVEFALLLTRHAAVEDEAACFSFGVDVAGMHAALQEPLIACHVYDDAPTHLAKPRIDPKVKKKTSLLLCITINMPFHPGEKEAAAAEFCGASLGDFLFTLLWGSNCGQDREEQNVQIVLPAGSCMKTKIFMMLIIHAELDPG